MRWGVTEIFETCGSSLFNLTHVFNVLNPLSFSLMKALSLGVLSLAVIGLGTATLLGFLGWERFGQFAMLFDLFSHFRIQYFLSQCIVLLLLLGLIKSQ